MRDGRGQGKRLGLWYGPVPVMSSKVETSTLGAGMELPMHGLEPLLVHMGVDLRS